MVRYFLRSFCTNSLTQRSALFPKRVLHILKEELHNSQMGKMIAPDQVSTYKKGRRSGETAPLDI